MATKIVTKNSSTASAVPTASDLVQGELAVNVADKRLFTEDNAGAIVELGTNPYNFTANHNGSAKLATTSTGIDVTGNLTMASGGSIVAGGANDLILNAGESGTPDIYLQSGSSTKVKIEGSDGSVGIGNSNPSAFNTLGATDKLVVGDSTVSNLTLFGTNYGSLAFADSNTSGSTAQYAGLIQYYHADNSMQFYTSSTERMRLDSDGATIYNGKELRIKRPNGSGDIRLFNTSTYATIESTVDPIYIKSANAIRFDTNGNDQRMLIDNAGKVGIGTSSPSTKLHLGGTAPLDSIIRQDSTASGTNWEIGEREAGKWQIWEDDSDSVVATFTSSGNVGIGTSLPTGAKLQVVTESGSNVLGVGTTTQGLFIKTTGTTVDYNSSGNFGGEHTFSTGNTERMRIDSSGNLLVGKTATGTVQGFEVQADGEVYSTIVNGLNTYHVYANSGYRFYVKPDGGIVNYSSNNVNLSDEREKKNIEPLESQWDSLKQWSLKKFHYNADADSENKKYGVIAQEVETHNPEVIDEFNVDDETTRMAVKEQQMMWMAIKALQEAQTRIETLEARVTELENN